MTLSKVYPAFLVFAALAPWWTSTATAACTGSSPTRTAAGASRQDVADCVTAAVSGDTIRVPAGSATWSSPIALPASKDLTLQGATVVACSGAPIACTAADNTRISCGTCFEIHIAAAHRITGFTMPSANDGGISTVRNGNQNPSKYFRIDHNRIVSTSGWAPMEITGGTNGVHPQGLIDNNIFVDISVHANGTNFQLDEANYQHVIWSHPTPLGDNSQIIYIEDNHYQNTSANVNNADANYGGRYVYRFNNTTSGRQACEVHSVQGLNRASQRFEIYKNSGASPSGFSGTAFIRGGSGVAFGNRLANGSWNFGIVMDNVRSERNVGEGAGQCNGTSNWDQNTPGQSGYACRDQIGRAYDLTQWSPGQPYAQAHQPVYFWDNIRAGGAYSIDNSGLDTWIRENRDWYRATQSFNGTSGVGEGPIAQRPAACTTGVAYWATDEGEWNTRQSGPDGRLYKCTSTNTWSLYYTPFAYPHPLQGGSPVGPLLPPTNLITVVK